jgi:tetratricopeptide (TPR) repeat protein
MSSHPTQSDDAAAIAMKGVAMARQERYEQAVALFRRAIALDPKCRNAHRNLALALRKTWDSDGMVAAAREGLALDPGDAVLHTLLAEALRFQKRGAEALAHAEEAVRLAPEDADAWANLSLLYADMGNAARAADAAGKAVGLNPNMTQAHRSLVHTRKYTEAQMPHVRQMEDILSAGGLDVRGRAEICFALGKAYDDLGRFDEAFAHYRDGNRYIRGTFEFSMEPVRRNFDQFAAAAEVALPPVAPDDGPVPVFIVGMPRSGTSLVEQILASHPAVHGGGELDTLGRAQFRTRKLRPAQYAEQLKRLTAEELQVMARDYLSVLRRDAPHSARAVTDKMPLNFRFIPIIRILFPQAKIIHCRRDMRDVAISNFRALFGAHLPFAYDLDELASYIEAYEKLMNVFTRKYGDAIHTVQYEELVKEPEAGVRALLKFCGLPWDAACLDFHRNSRPVVTASNYQVRQPVYTHSIGTWRRYGANLQPYALFDLHK